jgi:hypothetical protein
VKTLAAARRFPPPWSIEELDACYVVRDHDGQQLAYVYFEEEPGRRSAAKSKVIRPVSMSAFGGKADIGATLRNC